MLASLLSQVYYYHDEGGRMTGHVHVAVFLTVVAGLKGAVVAWLVLLMAGQGNWWAVGFFGPMLALILVQRAVFFRIWAR